MCVRSDSITHDINIFSCYMCSVRKQRKKRVDAVLHVIASSRKQTFCHGSGFNTIPVVPSWMILQPQRPGN